MRSSLQLLFSAVVYVLLALQLDRAAASCVAAGFVWPRALGAVHFAGAFLLLRCLRPTEKPQEEVEVPLRNVFLLAASQAAAHGLAWGNAFARAATTTSTSGLRGTTPDSTSTPLPLLPIASILFATVAWQTVLGHRDEYLAEAGISGLPTNVRPRVGMFVVRPDGRRERGTTSGRRSCLSRVGLYFFYIVFPHFVELCVGVVCGGILAVYHFFRVFYCTFEAVVRLGRKIVVGVVLLVYFVATCGGLCRCLCPAKAARLGQSQSVGANDEEEAEQMLRGESAGGGAGENKRSLGRGDAGEGEGDLESGGIGNSPEGVTTERQREMELTNRNSGDVDVASPPTETRMAPSPDDPQQKTSFSKNWLDISSQELALPPAFANGAPSSALRGGGARKRLQPPTKWELLALCLVCLSSTPEDVLAWARGVALGQSLPSQQERPFEAAAATSPVDFLNYVLTVVTFTFTLTSFKRTADHFSLSPTAMLRRIAPTATLFSLLFSGVADENWLPDGRKEELLSSVHHAWSAAVSDPKSMGLASAWRSSRTFGAGDDDYGKYLRLLLPGNARVLLASADELALAGTEPQTSVPPLQNTNTLNVHRPGETVGAVSLLLPHTWLSQEVVLSVGGSVVVAVGILLVSAVLVARGTPVSFLVVDRAKAAVAGLTSMLLCVGTPVAGAGGGWLWSGCGAAGSESSNDQTFGGGVAHWCTLMGVFLYGCLRCAQSDKDRKTALA
eukprot:g17360.t1